MKVLQVNCVYGTGSTGKITKDIHLGLTRQGHESVVCYGRLEPTRDDGVIRICSDLYAKANGLLVRFSGLMYGGCRLSTARLIRFIQKEKPDVVHIQCINNHIVNIYQLIRWLKENHIKTIATLHAEFMYTANCPHAYDCDRWQVGCGSCPRWREETRSYAGDRTAESFRRMKEAFEGFGEDMTVVSVSGWLDDRAAKSPILQGIPRTVIRNGVDTEIFRHTEKQAARTELDLPDGPVVFHATAEFSDAPDNNKGGAYVLELARRMKDVRFLVACNRHSVSGGVPENVTILGSVRDQRSLAKYYSAADVSLVTSRRETFSMPCAESLCCGTPVVGFRAGAPETISLKAYSEFVEFGDTDALEAVLKGWLKKEVDRSRLAELAAQTYSRETMIEQYIQAYRRLACG